MRLGFDIDEVVVDMTASLLEFIYNKYKISRSIGVFERYGLEECKYVLDDEMNKEIGSQLRKLVYVDTFLYNLRPIHGAVDFINVLHSQGHSVYFITSRADKNSKVTLEWFDKHKIPHDGIVTTNGEHKGEYVNNYMLDVFVDDHSDYLDSIISVNKVNTKLLLLDKPWNLCYNNKKVKRVLNWYEIMREIDEYTKTSKK